MHLRHGFRPALPTIVRLRGPANPLLAVALALLAVWAWPRTPTASAGSLEGHITLTPWSAPTGEASVNPYPGVAGTHCDAVDQRVAANDVKDVVITLVRESASDSRANGAGDDQVARRRPQLNQVGQAFVPRVLAIPVGTTVDFYNFDPIFHNVFSYSKAKRFDLGRYGKGKFRSVTFDRAGLVKVYCDIHANMAAYIYVVEGPLVIQPDENGNFQLRGISPGNYAVKLWHPERGERTMQVEVKDGVTRLDVSL